MNAFFKMFGGTMGCLVAVLVMGAILIVSPIACTMVLKQAVKTRELQQKQAQPSGTAPAPIPTTTKGVGR